MSPYRNVLILIILLLFFLLLFESWFYSGGGVISLCSVYGGHEHVSGINCESLHIAIILLHHYVKEASQLQ